MQFLERFADRQQTLLYPVANKIVLVATKEEIERLLSLYETVWNEQQGRLLRVVPLTKLQPDETQKLLNASLQTQKPHPQALLALPLKSNALLLAGPTASVEQAEQLIKESEAQILSPSETTLSLYPCRHSDPQHLATLLERVYAALPPHPPTKQPDPPQDSPNKQRCFIPATQTGHLLLIVRRETLPHIHELLEQLDVPKQMVHIDVLLFERSIQDHHNGGLNLLKLHPSSGQQHYTASYHPPATKGILQFLCQGSLPNSYPSYELAYNFLMTQRGMQLNAAPSITTVNQTPATISIQEEMSIHTGSATIETRKGVATEKVFTRASYGTHLILTPIVHPPQQGKGTITLRTDLTFETTSDPASGQPLVQRRRIENEVRVADGETIILGGLRRKASRSHRQQLPLLGQLPGIGQLFGSKELANDHSEMFFLITPRIVRQNTNTHTEQQQALRQRPGDLPELLQRICEAKEQQQREMLHTALHSLTTPEA